jgi:hypothetical protein
MFIFIDTNFKLSKSLIQNLFYKNNSENLDIEIIQLNCNKSNEYEHYLLNNKNDNDILINKIKSFLLNSEKKVYNNLLIKLCLMYFNGGIFINNNIELNNLSLLLNIYNSYDLFTIKSIVNNDKIFDGIISAKKENKLLLEIINIYLDNPEVDLSKLIFDKLQNDEKNDEKKILLNEKIIEENSYIYFNNNIIAKHFINSMSIIENIKILKKIENMNLLKIGITIPIDKEIVSLYSNGIKQNCLYLYELFKNIGYDVKLVIPDNRNVSIFKEIDFYNFEYLTVNDFFNYDFDVIFSIGFSITNNISKCLKNIGVKIIYYMCGNNYLVDSEQILYDQHPNREINYKNDAFSDQVWIIPQMYNQNKHYCETVLRKECIQIPFVWSPMSINFISKMYKITSDDLLYKKKNDKIGIFEPNISIMKWCLPCVLIAEKTYRNYKNVSHVYITNIADKEKNKNINSFNKKSFNDSLRNLDLFKDEKLSSEGRFVTLNFMRNYCDIAISHQWENNLNYLYFDLAWMGWPILHNANLCKDVGYYYEGFNYDEASEKLNNIILHHNSNKDEYLKKNRLIIDNYLPTNKSLQNKYKCLIENLFS